MSKIEQAVGILNSMGLPRAQVNDRGGLTLLALLDLKEDAPWSEARKNSVRVHDILQFSERHYGKKYAENSRETFRRFTLHQFEQAGIVVRNQDDPTRPTNSPDNNYTISDEALDALRKFDSEEWPDALKGFIQQKGRLIEIYDRRKKANLIHVGLPEGLTIDLSPGGHNELQRDIIKEFLPRFVPKAQVLYLGDTADKMLFVQKARLEEAGIPITEHDKLPDVVLYEPEKKLLLLIEAVTAHGPVTAKRRHELEEILEGSNTRRVYISAFPHFKEYKKYASEIAWETEVWISAEPEHMIHKNGEKFFTVYQ